MACLRLIRKLIDYRAEKEACGKNEDDGRGIGSKISIREWQEEKHCILQSINGSFLGYMEDVFILYSINI